VHLSELCLQVTRLIVVQAFDDLPVQGHAILRDILNPGITQNFVLIGTVDAQRPVAVDVVKLAEAWPLAINARHPIQI
jgi:hypothetical protein